MAVELGSLVGSQLSLSQTKGPESIKENWSRPASYGCSLAQLRSVGHSYVATWACSPKSEGTYDEVRSDFNELWVSLNPKP